MKIRVPDVGAGEKNLRSILRHVLSEHEWNKLEAALRAREDSSIDKVIQNLIKVIPASIKPQHRIQKDVIERIESIVREKQWVVIRLNDGLNLCAFPSRQQYRNYYYCFRDQLPQSISPESYQAAHDITYRLEKADRQMRFLAERRLFQHHERTSIIECGAYNGWKALGYARHLGHDGKIIAIEMDDEQFELCRANLTRNLRQKNFAVVHTGIWNAEEEREYSFEHHASHTLNTPDEHQHHTQFKKIKTNTLDNIIDDEDVDVFDFLNIQTGGSELESVEGLSRNLSRVKVIWVGSHYVHNGISIRWKCIKHLLKKGCRIYFDTLNRQPLGGLHEVKSLSEVRIEDTGGFWAVTPDFTGQLVPNCSD